MTFQAFLSFSVETHVRYIINKKFEQFSVCKIAVKVLCSNVGSGLESGYG
jgi:hypothetical protein